MIILRHFTSQLITTLLAVATVLLSIVMTSRFINYLGKSLDGQLSPEFLLTVIMLKIPSFLELILPLAFLIAILLTYGKKYADSEMVILQASGVGPLKLLSYTLPAALIIAAITALVTLYISPRASTHYALILDKERKTSELELGKREQFQIISRGTGVIYAEAVEPTTKVLQQVFLAETSSARDDVSKTTIVRSKTAGKQFREDYGQDYFLLNQGTRYEGAPGDKNYTITTFDEMGQYLKPVDSWARYTSKVENRDTLDLIASDAVADIAALQWRLSIPLIVLEMALIGVPLSKTSPRKGGYARIIPAILFFMLYMVALNSVKGSIVKNDFNPSIGLWPLHLIPVVLGAFMLLKGNYWRAPKTTKTGKKTT